MKETNSVPAWEEEAKPDEVLVQTSTGLFKFQGTSFPLNLWVFFFFSPLPSTAEQRPSLMNVNNPGLRQSASNF